VTLVDTSVWVAHLRSGNARLAKLLRAGEVFSHPFVVGELACGNLRNRQEILVLLAALPQASVAEHGEVMTLLESSHLFGRGVGWVDLHLLTSALLSRCVLWTLDRPLQHAAATLKIAV
jgi:predicted nucleic acid-binding protein